MGYRTANTNLEDCGGKILQISPISSNLKVESVYRDSDGEFTCPVVCMALVEYADQSREVVFMETDGSGVIDVAGLNIQWEWQDGVNQAKND